MQFALTFNSPSSNHLIETFGISKLEFLTLVKGVIQSIRFACSVQKPSGSSIERLYMVLYASSSIRARAAVAGGMGTNSVISAFLLFSAPHEKLRGGRALCVGVALEISAARLAWPATLIHVKMGGDFKARGGRGKRRSLRKDSARSLSGAEPDSLPEACIPQPDLLARIVAAFGAGEKDNRPCRPFRWNMIGPLKLADGVHRGVPDRKLHVGCDRAGAEAENGDAICAAFQIRSLGQHVNAGLGGAVMRPAFKRRMGGAGRNVDDRTRSLR